MGQPPPQPMYQGLPQQPSTSAVPAQSPPMYAPAAQSPPYTAPVIQQQPTNNNLSNRLFRFLCE